jgi:YggT family protein
MPQFILGQFVHFIASALSLLLNFYFWLIIIGALLSWVSPDPRNPIVRFIYGVTEPVLYHIRRRLPFVIVGGLDLSPIVVILGILFAQTVIVESLRLLAYDIQKHASALRAVVG